MPRLAPSTRRLIENLLSNYGYIGLLAVVPLVLVPLYLRLLGATAWGDVALCLTLQGFLFSLDLAVGPLMLRDVARAAAGAQAPSMYRRFLRIYAGTALTVAALVLAALALIADYRSARAEPMSADTLHALCLALVQFVFQFGNNAAIGYWNGLERQRLANLRLAGFTLAKHATALIFLTIWRADATAYMSAFVLVAAVEFAVNARRVLREPAMATADAPPPRTHDALGYAAAAMLGLAAAQIDRGYLSLALPRADYGLYFLVGVPMLTLFSLQMPIQRAYLPRLATAASPRRVAASILTLSLCLIAAPALLLAACPTTALGLWLHDPALAARGAPAFRLLMLAVAMNAAFAPAGLLLLNRHRNITIGALNALNLLVQTALLIGLTPRLGMLAGAVAWLACGLIQLAAAPWIWRSSGGPAHEMKASAQR